MDSPQVLLTIDTIVIYCGKAERRPSIDVLLGRTSTCIYGLDLVSLLAQSITAGTFRPARTE